MSWSDVSSASLVVEYNRKKEYTLDLEASLDTDRIIVLCIYLLLNLAGDEIEIVITQVMKLSIFTNECNIIIHPLVVCIQDISMRRSASEIYANRHISK